LFVLVMSDEGQEPRIKDERYEAWTIWA